jgi:hypothetical protein
MEGSGRGLIRSINPPGGSGESHEKPQDSR